MDEELELLIDASLHGSGEHPVSFEQIETTARSYAMKFAAQFIQSAVNGDHSDYVGPFCSCVQCGSPARFGGRKSKLIVTVVGEITLLRAYYVCEHCGRGFYPRDTRLHVDGGSLSEGLTRMIGLTAALVSFREAEELITSLSGLGIGAKHIERTAKKLGEQITTDEKEHIIEGVPRNATLYLGMDGTGIPMRPEELKGRHGKQPDGSAKTREVKLVTVWSADGKDKAGIPVRDVGSVSYNAAIESAATRDTDETLSDFACRVEREATRRGFYQAKRQIIIGDGAKWIWNIADELFPDALQIVDLYHAKGNVSTAAKAIFGIESEYGRQWAKSRRDELEDGKIDSVIAALQPYVKSHKEADACCTYLRANMHRMAYPQFRSQGLCTSSGVVEAGCKLAIGTRLKRAGMHWSLHGANSIIALRCCKLSNRYDDYWERKHAA